MTREEAIAILIREVDDDPFMRTEYREQIHEALNIAIKALEHPEENVVAIVPCEDPISRQAVLDLAKKGVLISNDSYKSVCRVINDLPSVNPVKTGHWKYYQNDKGDWINECSVCGSDAGVGYQYPYCPNCGAKMVEPQESEGTDADSN